MGVCNWLPRLSALKVIIICALLSLAILASMVTRINVFMFPLRMLSGGEKFKLLYVNLKEKHTQSSPFRVATSGENIQVEDLQVHLTTAVHNEYPDKRGFNLFINGWARNNTAMSFKCCLMLSLPEGPLVDGELIEVRSYTYHIYTQWIVDMQNAEFSCSISEKQITAIGDAKFSYVTFAKESCLNAPPLVLEIIYPKPVPNSVGVCLKITYGSLNPENMVEWFEYTRLMGVKKVFTYYFDPAPEVMKVLEYYKSIGFMDMLPIHPAVSKATYNQTKSEIYLDGHRRGFNRPRYEEQAWVDEVMAANDCKHRMAKFDYVIILDMDEFILPKGDLQSYYDILQAASKIIPQACSFSFNSHVVMPDWGETRKSPLNICRYVNRTVEPNYNGESINTRWAFRPTLTYWVQNNLVHCRNPYHTASVPEDMYILFHYRPCKHNWTGCTNRSREKDTSMVKYELPLITRVLSLPWSTILYDHEKYIYGMINWRKNYKNDSNPSR